MKKTHRMQRGLLSFLFIVFFLILWFFFSKLYPLILEQITIILLPLVDSNIFLLPVGLLVVGLLVSWSFRNKLWFGLCFSVPYYLMVKRIRRHIKDARFENEREFDNRLVKLPTIKIVFDDNHARKSGKVFIQNSIKFDKKLEDMRIDSALERYVSEVQYLSKDRNWYIFEFYAVDSQKHLEIKSADELIAWSNKKTDNYTLRLDERATVPFHHMGLVGQTGSGKSFLIQMLVEQVLLKKVRHELFTIDPKRTDVHQMAKRTVGDDRIADKTNAIELIKQFHERMKKRQDELQDYFISNRNKTYKDAGLPAQILLIDEFGALRESWKTLAKKERDEVDSMLSDVAFMGRQLGCILWVATQQMNAQTMPTAIREQLVLKIALGDSDEQTYRTLFSSGVDIPPIQFTAGQWIYSYPGLASADKPRLLTVPYCSFLN
ncbi:TPA: ATP-binding protein [Listeria innocua]|nr:ATP-binding protein [Listeria innocua]HBM3680424.1 ATP-binding protein [Listeria innocua]HBM3882880.1 ATP-binding protein [Listeria innocua]HBM4017478.1 ATP-binding protein [Listeria innocua]HBM4633855.1 ATP-binding protein [Listeria innocua]